MEGTKKRKRDADLPRITYDAATRTFDRLFKEDTLEGMKDVVRRKLGVSATTTVHLAQLRDGRMVDLEDDEDFEAFSSSAYHGLTARVKVTVDNETSTSTAEGRAVEPLQATEGATTPKKKSKKEKKKKQNDALEASKTPEPAAADSEPPAKKRRVSFFQENGVDEARTALLAALTTNNVAASTENTPEQERAPVAEKPLPSNETLDSTNALEDREKRRKDRKKKRKDMEKPLESSVEVLSKEGTPADGEAKKKKKKKKGVATVAEDAISPANPEDSAQPKVTVIVQSTVDPSVPQPKKSKKRARVTEPDSVDNNAEDIVAPNPVVEPEAINPTVETRERETKKLKKAPKSTIENAFIGEEGASPSENAVADILQPKTPKKTRRKSDAQSLAPPKEPAPETSSSLEPRAPTSTVQSIPPAAQIVQKLKSKKAEKGKAVEKPAVEAKTPKKTTKKNADIPEPTGEAAAERDKVRADLQALVARMAGSAGTSTPAARTLSEPVAGVTNTPATKKPLPTRRSIDTSTDLGQEEALPAISSAKQAGVPAPSNTGQESDTPVRPNETATPSAKISAKRGPNAAKTEAPASCPICEEAPGHVRTKCPLVKKGIKAMQKRIAELEKETAEDEDAGNAELIAELHTLIEGKRRKPRASLANTAAQAPVISASAVKSVVDASTSSPAIDAVNSSAAQPSDAEPTPAKEATAQPAKAATSIPSQSISSARPVSSTQLLAPFIVPTAPLPPPSTQPSLSAAKRSRTQPPLSQPRLSLSQPTKTKTPRTSNATLFTPPTDLSLANNSNLFAFGDISTFTDRDIEELMRGPKLTSQDVPSEDETSAEEDQQEPGVLEEEEIEVTSRGPRKSTQRDYPSSSDQGEDDDDEEEPSPMATDSAAGEELLTDATPQPSSVEGDDNEGEQSFMNVDDANTSQSSAENAGASAAVDAIDDSLDMRASTPQLTSKPARRRSTIPLMDGESDTVVENVLKDADPPTEPVSPEAALMDVDEDGPDPIEVIEEPLASQAESIASDTESIIPKESTPKKGVVLRARSQRGKSATSSSTQAPASQSQASQEAENADETTPKPSGRKTRSLTRISELPIPPNPSVRTTRAAALPPVTPRTTRLRARAESKTADAEDTDEPSGPKTRAKTPARATKTAAAKPPSKAAGKAAAAKPPSKAAAKPASVTKTAAQARTRASKLVADLESAEEAEEDEAEEGEANPEASLASWAVLPDNGPSQGGASQMEEHSTMLDELISSPDFAATKTGASQPRDASQDPLFILSESQHSYPYSQYPDQTQRMPSPNDSDGGDEDEVAAVIRPAAHPRPSQYRTLTEIAKEGTRFARRESSQMANTSTRDTGDFYGLGGKDDEDEEEEESESDAEPQQHRSSHIPETRRAGAAVPRRK